uniref:SH2 domain-containing protein n=1 Tax=Ciona savignyi TaxID=51511 RepID=H2Z9T3_CIOSA
MRGDALDSFAELEAVLAEMEALTPILNSTRANSSHASSSSSEASSGIEVSPTQPKKQDVWIRRFDFNDDVYLVNANPPSPPRPQPQKSKKSKRKTLTSVPESGKSASVRTPTVKRKPSFRRHTVTLNSNYVRYDDPADQLTIFRKQQVADFYGTHSCVSSFRSSSSSRPSSAFSPYQNRQFFKIPEENENETSEYFSSDDSKDTLQSNDDVFSQDQSMPQPSYPPRTSQTRPPQQQIIGRTLSSTSYPTPKKPIEERLSPQLFLAMSVNPGARPIEDIHSYKEDLLPESPRDKNSPTTPAFPITPKTPYTNLTSPSSHVPIGITKTPLSELGLKPKPQIESETISTVPQWHCPSALQLNSATKQHQVTNRTSPGFATQSHLTSSHQFAIHALYHDFYYRLDERTLPSNHQPTIGSRDPTTQEYIHGTFTTSPHQPTHMGGYSDNNVRSNGWHQQHSPVPVAGGNKDLRSPWVFNEDTSPIASSPAGKSPVISSIASSSSSSSSSPPRVHGSGEVSPAGTRSLNGSHDSLLSGGSGPAHQTHHAYQKDRYSHTIQKDSRNSASSIQSTSTGGSGYLGGASQTSPHSAGSSNSGSGQYPFSHQIVNKRESQMSSYDRHGGHHFHSSDDGGLSSPASGRTIASSQSDIDKLAHEVSQANLSAPPKFVKETTAYWYKPDITREQALALLRTKPAGSFVVRASRCYPGAYGLALKVSQVPAGVLATAKPGTDMNNELVRHFLIEPSTRGVKLKGCPNEPVFGSLSALIYQHSITPLALPCKLVIPTQNQEIPPVGSSRNSTEIQNSAVELLKLGAACNVLYLGSEDTESLTGPEAIERAMRECMHNEGQAVKTSVVHFKVSPQGITLTDNARKIFFRRHYPTSTVTYCGMDPSAREPHNRRWDASKDRGPPNSRVFGFVAKKPGSSVENVCHLFAELDLDQPAPAIVNFVSKVLIGTAGAN